VTSAVVQQTEQMAKRPKLSPQQWIGIQTLDDALADKGAKKHSDQFPKNRRCMSLVTRREFCGRHSLSDVESDSAQRKAFLSMRKVLDSKELIRIVDDWLWRRDG
jgi:hypothetical protein